jgi:hypothetical protein
VNTATVVLTGCRVAKGQKSDKYVPAKIDAEVVRMGKIVAAYRDIDLNVYLSEILEPIVRQHLAEHAAETAAAPPAKPKDDKPRGKEK